MIKFITTLLLATSFFSVSMAANKLESGTYLATDVDSGTIQATILVRPDQTLIFNVTTPDFTMPAPGCNGKFIIENSVMSADLTCPIEALPQIHVDINLVNVTPETVRQENGVMVDVILDVVGPDPMQFMLKKLK